MEALTRLAHPIRFGAFELDLHTQELRKHGLKLKLHGQPIEVLAMLLERPGELLTREELHKKLWPEDTFVDFEHGINAVVNRLREALGDDADTPCFIETLPRRGYRFIAAVESLAPGPSPRGRGEPVILSASQPSPLGRGDPGPSIAVLPLENLSCDPDQEYFADGMTEELITNLGKISALRVISRTSVMRYKGTKKSLPEIARELNVDAIIEGTVLRSGKRVRITANLLDADNDRHLWAESYERDLRDILALQSDVAQAIAREVQVKLTPQEQTRLARALPVNPEAYEAYLKGRHLEYLDNAKAVEFHQRATQIDPTWAPAHAAIVTSTLVLGLPPMEACAKARAAAGKALELDNTLSEAHSAMAQVKLDCDWDWPGTEREFKRALELDPSNSKAHHFYSHYLLAMRRFDESLIESKRALELDPLSEVIEFHLAWHYVWAHQPDLAIEQCRKWLEVFPNSVLGHLFRMLAYEMKGLYEEAIGDELDSKMAARLKRAYGRFGARGYWQSRLDSALEQSNQHYFSPLIIAGFYAQLGQREEAFAWLGKAYDERSVWMAQLSCDPRFDPLRSDPRFQALLRHMNFPP